MAYISKAQRERIPSSEMGLPSEHKYPVNTKKRARSAKSYASKEYNAGKLSKSQKAAIDRKADRKLHGAGAKHLHHESTSHPLAK